MTRAEQTAALVGAALVGLAAGVAVAQPGALLRLLVARHARAAARVEHRPAGAVTTRRPG